MANSIEFPPYREEYVREALAWGWWCPKCHAFTSDEKEFRTVCRCCEYARPRVEYVVRGTHGKR